MEQKIRVSDDFKLRLICEARFNPGKGILTLPERGAAPSTESGVITLHLADARRTNGHDPYCSVVKSHG